MQTRSKTIEQCEERVTILERQIERISRVTATVFNDLAEFKQTFNENVITQQYLAGVIKETEKSREHITRENDIIRRVRELEEIETKYNALRGRVTELEEIEAKFNAILKIGGL